MLPLTVPSCGLAIPVFFILHEVQLPIRTSFISPADIDSAFYIQKSNYEICWSI